MPPPIILLVLLSMIARLQAAVTGAPPFPDPPQALRFPADSGAVDITKPPYGAVPDGVTDCTEAIQKALTERQNLIYFPKGTYLVSATLRWGLTGKNTTNRQIFQGESSAGSIIRLKDACPGFGNPASPREVVWTGKFPPQSFRNGLRNLTIDTGRGNPGAIGVRYYGNNQAGCHDLVVRSGDGKGAIGLDLGFAGDQGPCLLRMVRVEGFDIGVSLRHASAGVVFEFLELRGQNRIGIDNRDQPVSIRGLRSSNAVTAIRNGGGALITLIDATLEGAGAAATLPAIANDTGLFVRNLKVSGYGSAVAGRFGGPDGLEVDEWTSHAPLSLFPSPLRSLNLPVEETPDPAWEDPSLWVSAVKHGPTELARTEGGKTRTVKDYAASLQRVIDEGATTIYLPRGAWPMNGTVRIRGRVARIIGVENSFGGPQTAEATWIVEDGAAPVVRIERIDAGYSVFNLRNASPRTVVLSSINGTREGVIGSEPGSGKLFIEDVANCMFQFRGGRIWARQINPELGYGKFPGAARDIYTPGYDKMLNDGATLWILGLKTEGDGTNLTNLNGARSEILGGFVYANKAYRPEKQWVVNKDSSVSLSLAESVIRNQPFDPVYEVRGAETRILPKGSTSGRGAGSLVVLYTGYKGSATAPPTAVTALRAQTLDATRIALSWGGGEGRDAFQVQRRDGDAWRTVATVAGTRAEVAHLPPGTACSLRVTAFNGAGESASAPVEATTAARPPPGRGTGLRAERFADRAFGGEPAVALDALLDLDLATAQPAPAAVRWTGWIEPLFSEEYTFAIASDGVRLWIGDRLVIDAERPGSRTRRGAIALDGGVRVPIKLEYAAAKMGRMSLSWSSAAQESQIVPASQLHPATGPLPTVALEVPATATEGGAATVTVRRLAGPPTALIMPLEAGGSAVREDDYLLPSDSVELAADAATAAIEIPLPGNAKPEPDKTLVLSLRPGATWNVVGDAATLAIADDDRPPPGRGTGLAAVYFARPDFTAPASERIDPVIDFSWDKKAPAAKTPAANYSVRWSGEIEAQYDETYTISVPSSIYSTVRLTVGGQVVVDAKQKDVDRRGTVRLQAGKKQPIVLEYANLKNYGSNIRMVWASDSQFEQIVPSSQLHPAGKP